MEKEILDHVRVVLLRLCLGRREKIRPTSTKYGIKLFREKGAIFFASLILHSILQIKLQVGLPRKLAPQQTYEEVGKTNSLPRKSAIVILVIWRKKRAKNL